VGDEVSEEVAASAEFELIQEGVTVVFLVDKDV